MKWPFHLRFRLTFIGLILLTLLLIILCDAFGIYRVTSVSQTLGFLQQNRMLLLLWRLLMIAGLFFIWPYFIRYRARHANWPAENIAKAMHLRYWLVIFLLSLDGLFQWSAGG